LGYCDTGNLHFRKAWEIDEDMTTMREPLSTSQYMLYHALCQGSPATLNDLIERLQCEPYEWEVSVTYLAALAGRLEEKGYVRREKVASGRRGQPPTEFEALVPLREVVRFETARALRELAWGDRETLLMVREVVDEELAKERKSRLAAEARKGRPRQDGRTLRRG